MNSSVSKKSKFDPGQIIVQALSYAAHLRLMLIMFAFGILLGIGYYIYSTPVYEVRSLIGAQVFGSDALEALQEEQGLPTTSAKLRTNLGHVIATQALQLRAAKKLGIVGPEADYTSVLAVVPKVRVQPIDTYHFDIQVFSTDQETVRNYSKAMVDAYLETQENRWRDYRNRALELYAEDMSILKEQVEKGREELFAFEREQSLTELNMEQQNLLQIPKQLVEVREKIGRMKLVKEALSDYSVDADMDSVIEQLSLVSAFNGEKIVEVGDMVRKQPALKRNSKTGRSTETVVIRPEVAEEGDGWQTLEKERRDLLVQQRDAAEKYLPGHAISQEISDRLEKTNQALRSELAMMKRALDLDYVRSVQREQELESRLPEYHEVAAKFGKSSLEFSLMEQSQKIWEDAQAKLENRLSKLDYKQNRGWIDLEFLGNTFLRDQVPVSPNKMKLIMLALGVGIAGAVGLPTVLNMMKTHAATLDKLEERTGLQGLGIIPMASKNLLEEVNRSPAVGAKVPNSLLESFRLVRANISLRAGRNGLSQSIMVTSARPQEGKTTLSSNLAWAFQSIGERTLLIDCDLRRGRVHGVTGIENRPGLTRALVGENSFEESVMKTSNPLLDVLPRGPVIIGTTELLCQKLFSDALQRFRKEYDRIVIDCPPVLGLSETGSLQSLVDGVVVVTRAEATSCKEVEDAVQVLRKSGAYLFGFVLNAIDLKKLSNYYHYSYYSANYYEIYDEEPQDEEEVEAERVALT